MKKKQVNILIIAPTRGNLVQQNRVLGRFVYLNELGLCTICMGNTLTSDTKFHLETYLSTLCIRFMALTSYKYSCRLLNTTDHIR